MIARVVAAAHLTVDAGRREALRHVDDTPVPVLGPGTGKTKTGRLWTHHASAVHKLPVLFVVMNNSMWGAVRRATLGMYPHGEAARSNKPPHCALRNPGSAAGRASRRRRGRQINNHLPTKIGGRAGKQPRRQYCISCE